MYSSKIDAITITVLNSDLNSHLKDRFQISITLQNKIAVTVNENENGIATCANEQEEKCVITCTLLYNQTIFVQGKGCRYWKINVFVRMMDNYELHDISMSTADNSETLIDHVFSNIPS